MMRALLVALEFGGSLGGGGHWRSCRSYCAIARVLQSEQGIVASGILMLAPMLETGFQFGGDHFALGAALQLPSLAAAELQRSIRRALHQLTGSRALIAISGGGMAEPYRYFIHPVLIGMIGNKREARAL